VIDLEEEEPVLARQGKGDFSLFLDEHNL